MLPTPDQPLSDGSPAKGAAQHHRGGGEMRMRLVSRGIGVAILALFASLASPVRGEIDPLHLFEKVTIANRGHVPITGIYYKQLSNSEWTTIKLLAPIDPGKEFVMSIFHLGECRFDIQVRYNDTTSSEYRNADLCIYNTLTFAGPPATNYSGPFPAEVTVTNSGPADMLGLFISPSTEIAFGPNRLPAGPLRKDQNAVIPLPQIGAARTCLYDMEANFPGGTTNSACE